MGGEVDSMLQGITAFLIAQGPLGILSLILLVALYRIWTLYVAAQETRIEEAKESILAMQEYTKSLRILAEQYQTLGDTELDKRRRRKT